MVANKMFTEESSGYRVIGDGLLEATEPLLKDIFVREDINEIYDVEQSPFARGKFANVKRAVHKQTGVNYAAKFLRRRRRAQCTLKEIGHEIAILMLCADSSHIVKLHSVYANSFETVLLLELATGGELQAILDDVGALTEHQARICMQQVLKALDYLHKKCIAHLDLKPQNILLCGDKVEDGLKLCDFGISRIVEKGNKVREILGTPDYVAPEVLSYEPLSLKTDMWSVGVLAYVLLTGFSPFGGDTKQETFMNISQCNLTFPDELFENVSTDAIDFIKSVLRVNAHERMSADECLAHKWLREESPVKSLSTSTNCELLLTDCCDALNECIDNDDTKSIISNGSSASYLKQKLNKEYQQGTEVSALVTVTTTTATTTNGSVPHTNGTLTEQHQNGHTEFYLKEKNYKQTTSNCIQLNSDRNNKENISENRNVSKTHSTAVTTNGTDVRRQSVTSIGSSCVSITNHNDNHSTTNSFTLDIVDETVTTTQPTASSMDDISHHLSNGVAQSQESTLFPDAPTTPKVCRKSTSDSPTSVKNLVKKFQLDNQKDCSNIDAIHTVNNSMHLDMDCSGAFSPKKEHLITSSGIVKKISEALANGDDALGLNKIHKDRTTSARTSLGMTCISTISPNTSVSSAAVATSSSSSASSSSSSATSPASGKCACGKLPSSCCCHLLGLRGKSMVVIDNSIVC